MQQIVTRRGFLAGLSAAAALSSTRLVCGADEAPKDDGLVWHDVSTWGVEGKGFADTERYYDRLPGRAKGKVRDVVWNLSRHSTGMSARFESDATTLHVRYDLMGSALDMPHMPATAMSGIDFYASDDKGDMRWLSVVKPTNQRMNVKVVDGVAPGKRTFMIYLPLFNSPEKVEIGMPKNAMFTPIAPRSEKPIVFYGTSILHGACASRPGMGIINILQRRLNHPTINLAFSGNGTMEKSVGDFLVELDPLVYVIDCCPNMGAKTITERCIPLVKQLRDARPDVPIVLVEDRINSNAEFLPARYEYHMANHKALRESYDTLVNDGYKKLLYLPGDHLLGDDGEGSTDGSHASDLGAMRYADAYEPVLREAMKLA
ncbi:MAG: hypothetical protein GC162_18640 [Planctomycetes bacterium]|nr:hypothetical protein [Planctomycetota bacterium]